MDNSETLHKIIDDAQSNVFNQLLQLNLSPEEFEFACCKYAPHSFLCFIYATQSSRFEIRNFHFAIAAVLEHLAFSDAAISKRLILPAPPRSGKSTITQLFIAWLIGLNENSSHVFASYGQRLSNTFSSKIHNILTSPNYIKCFPKYQGFASNNKTQLKAGGQLFATSIGGSITGITAGSNQLPDEIKAIRALAAEGQPLFGTPGCFLVDDPLKSGASEAELETLAEVWVDEINTRRSGNWLQLIIATRFHVRDLHGFLLKRDGLYSEENPEGWLYLNIQALAESEDILGRLPGEALWPSHPTLNERELLRLQKANPQKFSALYQGEPKVENVGVVRREDLRASSEEWPSDVEYKILSIDPNYGVSDSADKTGLVLGAVTASGELWILESEACEGDFVALRSRVKEWCESFAPDEIVIELAANGPALYAELTTNPERFECEAFVSGIQARTFGSKTKRLGSVRDLLRLCNFAGEHHELRQQLLAFPHGENDDLVDALSYGLMTIRSSYESWEPEGKPEGCTSEPSFEIVF